MESWLADAYAFGAGFDVENFLQHHLESRLDRNTRKEEHDDHVQQNQDWGLVGAECKRELEQHCEIGQKGPLHSLSTFTAANSDEMIAFRSFESLDARDIGTFLSLS